MKIPDAEMPPVYTVRQLHDGYGLAFNPDSKMVGFGHYQRLYNERRFIPVEECSPWISVEERLPEVGREVIVLRDNGQVTALARFIRHEGDAGYFWDNHYPGKGNMSLQHGVTHWTPLPAPPEIKS